MVAARANAKKRPAGQRSIKPPPNILHFCSWCYEQSPRADLILLHLMKRHEWAANMDAPDVEFRPEVEFR